MPRVIVYLVLIVAAYLCQTVLYPALLVPELRVDLFLVLVVHYTFAYRRTWALVLALFLGMLMDVGLPLRGCFHPLFYMLVGLAGSMLWQNLNLHSRRYQAVFFGLCALVGGGGIWIVLGLQGAESAGVSCIARVLLWRTIATSLLGPLLLSGLERLDRRLSILDSHEEYQEQ